MIAIDKLMKIILVAFFVVLVSAGLYHADINRILRNVVPDYRMPEHEEIPVETIPGVCGEGWTKVARSVSGGGIGFCLDDSCSSIEMSSLKVIQGNPTILKIEQRFVPEWLEKKVGEIKDNKVFVYFSLKEFIDLGLGSEEAYSFYSLLDGAEVSGGLICLKEEEGIMIGVADLPSIPIVDSLPLLSMEKNLIFTKDKSFPGYYTLWARDGINYKYAAVSPDGNIALTRYFLDKILFDDFKVEDLDKYLFKPNSDESQMDFYLLPSDNKFKNYFEFREIEGSEYDGYRNYFKYYYFEKTTGRVVGIIKNDPNDGMIYFCDSPGYFWYEYPQKRLFDGLDNKGAPKYKLRPVDYVGIISGPYVNPYSYICNNPDMAGFDEIWSERMSGAS